jgi:hypothetical protein
MKRLISVFTCHSYQYPKHDEGAAHHSGIHENRSQAARNTWYQDWLKYKDEIDLRFFFGRWPQEATRCPLPNEVFLDAPDDYYGAATKVQAMFKWALDAKYQQVMKIDDDVFCYVSRLLQNLDNSDYRGYETLQGDVRFASGAAYILNHKAMQVVVDSPVDLQEWREDKWVGVVLAKNGISLVHDPRFQHCHCDVCLEKYPESTRITSHTTSPERMYELYKHLRTSI